MKQFNYSALGLRISSDIELSALPEPTERRPDVSAECIIRQLQAEAHAVEWDGLRNLDRAQRDQPPAHSPQPGIYRTTGGWLYRAYFEGEFAEVLVRYGGREVSWACSDEITSHDLASLLSGVMLSAAATEAGGMVLHGSVVQFRGQTLAILAGTGTGKSTTVLSILRAGGKLLSEDAFAVLSEEGSVRVFPGARMLRLGDDVLKAFDITPMEHPLVHLAADKRLLALSDAELWETNGQHVELDAILFLERGSPDEPLNTERLRGAAALKRLQSLMHPQWMYQSPSAKVFEQQFHLLDCVPSYTLRVPGSVEALRETIGDLSLD
jgi:hypothetical protein